MRNGILAGAGLVLVLSGTTTAQGPESEGDIKQAVKNLERNLLANGYKVKYEVTRNVASARDKALEHVPFPTSGAKPLSPYWRAEVARKRNWTYEQVTGTKEDLPPEKDRHSQVRIFSEKYGWMYNTAFKAVNFGRDAQVKSMMKALYPLQDIYSEAIGLEAAGQGEYNTILGLEPGGRRFSLAAAFDAAPYRVAGEPEPAEGLRCVRLENGTLDRVWLGVDRGYAVVKREWSWGPDGPLKVAIRNSDFRQVSEKDRVWLPRSCRVDYYGDPGTKPGQVVMTAAVKVTDLTYPVDDAAFTPDIKPGKEVWEFGGKMWYMPPRTGQSMDEVINKSAEYTRDLAKPAPRKSNLRMFFVLNGILVASLVLLFILKRRWAKTV